jgi:SecD/SecF fusion protein
MGQNLLLRFVIIIFTCGFLGWMAYRGVAGKRLELGIDLKGGTELVFKFDFTDITAPKAETLKTAIDIIQQRIDGYGMKDIQIQPIGEDRFAVQISATDRDKVDAVKDIITQLGKLEFRITVDRSRSENFEHYWTLFQDRLAKKVPKDQAVKITVEDLKPEDRARYQYGLQWYPLSSDGRRRYQVEKLPLVEGVPQPWVLCELDDSNITGENLENVRYGPDERVGGGFAVFFQVRALAQKAMTNLTATVGDHMAIILNEEVTTAPELQATLTTDGQITGGFTEDTARQLAAVLQAGALQDKPTLDSERTIAADLAGSARDRGILSVVLGFIVVLAVMAWLYYGPGMLANFALLLNIVILVGVLVWFDAVLTLPGLAGIVLTVGMSVDANILVYERMREEKQRGRTVAQAVALGYERALVTIIDSNLTTLITAYFLFQLGSGPVKGFGITLAIGIVASMFTALYVTHAIFDLLLRKKKITELKMRRVSEPPTISWTGRAMRLAVVGSAIAMAAGVAVWELAPEKVRYDLDFTQGSKLVMRLSEPVPMSEVRNRIEEVAREHPMYREMSIRATAEGVGQKVTADSSPAFEFRSQTIASKPDIEHLTGTLREIFKGKLLPGPLDATLKPAAGGGLTGELYFVSDRVKPELLTAAFRLFAENERKGLVGARVETLPAMPGAGSGFRVTFPSDESKEAAPFNVDAALRGLKLAEAKRRFTEISTSETSTPQEQDAAKGVLAALDTYQEADLTSALFDKCNPFPLADLVNPSTAAEHRTAAVQAMALSLIGIIVYVAFRFRSWSFGIASVIALIHDVVVTLGVATVATWLGLFDARLNLVTVAAYLTLIGYSINDTIVIFDRIRENKGAGGTRARLAEIIDRSVNQTMARTIRTSLTVWIVVLILLVFNYGANSALEGFAFILTFGLISGTYSTIFIASPTLLYLPWLWDRSGKSAKALLRKAAPFMVATAAVLIVSAYLHDKAGFAKDWTPPVFDNLILAVPIGALVFFLFNFVRFVRAERAEPQAA